MQEIKDSYVVGFLFSKDLKSVLLIRKKKPDWQVGRLNGIGGKVEQNESPYDAIKREFKEETDLQIDWWKLKVKMNTPDCLVYFYASIGKLEYAKKMTEEDLLIYQVNEISSDKINTIYNLKWLIRLCLESTVIFPIEIDLICGMKRAYNIPLGV